MKFDIASNPDPLPFGEGDDTFSLSLKQITGEERMAILDAARSGLMVEVQSNIDRLVIGWQGVVGADGNPVPLEYDEDGLKMKRFDAFLGVISCEMQIRVIAGILAFVGIPTGNIDEIVKIFGNAGDKPDTAPTAPPDDATTTSASGG